MSERNTTLTIRISRWRKAELLLEAEKSEMKLSAYVRQLLEDEEDSQNEKNTTCAPNHALFSKGRVRRGRSEDRKKWIQIKRLVQKETSRNLAISGEGIEPNYHFGWATTKLLKATLRNHEEWALLDCSKGVPAAPDYQPAIVVGTYKTKKQAQENQRTRLFSAVVPIEYTGMGETLRAAMSEQEILKKKHLSQLLKEKAEQRTKNEKRLVKMLVGETVLRLSEFTFVRDPKFRPAKEMAAHELYVCKDTISHLSKSIASGNRWVVLSINRERYLSYGVVDARPTESLGFFDNEDEGWRHIRDMGSDFQGALVLAFNDLAKDEFNDAVAQTAKEKNESEDI